MRKREEREGERKRKRGKKILFPNSVIASNPFHLEALSSSVSESILPLSIHPRLKSGQIRFGEKIFVFAQN